MLNNFGVHPDKMSESVKVVLNRASEEVLRRGQTLLFPEHLLSALIQVEWRLFSQIMTEANLKPQEILKDLEKYLKTIPNDSASQLEISPRSRVLLNLALLNAGGHFRQAVETIDILFVIFEEKDGVAISLVKQEGIEPKAVIDRILEHMKSFGEREKRLKLKFELPPFLKHFAVNLSQLAYLDRLPPVFFRNKEVAQIIEILCRLDRPNSVLLIGEPGVGKTAIVEGLAKVIEFEPEKVPARLRHCQVVNLQMNTLVAGTMLRGMFEERIQHVIREIKEHPNLILFIDEFHTVVGAGSALGTPADAADTIKSVLNRGEIRVIGATTSSEYKEHVSKDEALARRFGIVYIEEPTLDQTKDILNYIRPRIERNYSVRITDEALEMAIKLAPRYMKHLRLPSKVIDWLDTASVKVEIRERWEVTADDIIEVISETARIPREMVSRNIAQKLADLEERLSKRVIGQRVAVRATAKTIRLNKGPLKRNFDRPDAVLFFLGPTGVGKTELAKALAEYLFGDDKRMIRIDMSEYQDSITAVDKLIGMPSGFTRSERGGILTNQLRDYPYSVILLDEIEKACPTLLNLFLQAFDEGWVTDGHGKRAYLSDAVIIMTSNLGSENFKELTNPMGFRQSGSDITHVISAVMREFKKRFSPEFRNRIDEVVVFSPLTIVEVRQIAEVYLEEIRVTMLKNGKKLEYEKALDLLAKKGFNLAYGARFLKRTIDALVKVPITEQWDKGSQFTVGERSGEIVVEVNSLAEAVVV